MSVLNKGYVFFFGQDNRIISMIYVFFKLPILVNKNCP